MFKPYMHIERFGKPEVEGIELGRVFIFPKLDGTNSSIWPIGTGHRMALAAGSRTRELSLEHDNAGFLASLRSATNGFESENWDQFFKDNPNLRLFGEWLVPHTFKGYRPEAWRRFYIFDVMNDETGQYLSYETYKPLLDKYPGLTYLAPLAIINNGSYENFLKVVNENKYLCPDDGEPGEGVVLKNYDYYNKFNNQVWAKIVRQEFKEKHALVMGAPEINTGLMNEQIVLDKIPLQTLVEKTIGKIMVSDGASTGWQGKYIPQLFERVFRDIIVEELYDAVKEIKGRSINFKTLKSLMIMRIKQIKPELF